jgi:hypothetical protein
MQNPTTLLSPVMRGPYSAPTVQPGEVFCAAISLYAGIKKQRDKSSGKTISFSIQTRICHHYIFRLRYPVARDVLSCKGQEK